MQNKLVHKVLENGLEIYFLEDKNKHSIVIDLFVKYGGFYSDFEVSGKQYHLNNGMAHLLEHTMFEKNSVGNLANVFGSQQMNTDAITYPRYTEYYVDLVDHFDFALETLLKALTERSFTEEDIVEIKPPIYQEIRMREDEIGRKVFYTTLRNIFQKIPYRTGLGSIHDVEGFTYEQICLCYDAFYHPKNEILFIVGNIDIQKTLKKIEDIYKNYHFKEQDVRYIKIQEPKSVRKKYEVVHMPVAKDYINISYKIDFSKYTNEERRKYSYYLDLFYVMNFSEISPLHKKLVQNQIIDVPIKSDYDFYENYLVLSFSDYTNDEEAFIKEIQDSLKSPNVNSEVFDLQLKKFKMFKICSDATPMAVSRQFRSNLIVFDYHGLDSVEEINSLNYREYLQFISGLNFKYYTITKVTNEEE